MTNNLLLAFLLSMLLTGVIGVIIEKYIYHPIISKANVIPIVPLITSVGLFTLTGDLIRLISGPNVKEFRFEFPIKAIKIGKVVINPECIFIIILTAVLFAVLWFILNRTKLGLAWRATAEDSEIARAMGVNTNMSMALSYVLGYGFAAAAGIMVGMLYNSIVPTMGDIPSYKMLAIIVLGGLGNPVGTVVAGLVIGLAETFVSAYIGSVMPRDSIAFIVLIVVLLVKPSGLVSRKNA
jgi:branched-chain amino acid transport system permease protein